MVNTIVHEGKVYAEVDSLLDGLFEVCNQWANMQHGPNKVEAAQRAIGMIDLCKGLEELHAIWIMRHGLR